MGTLIDGKYYPDDSGIVAETSPVAMQSQMNELEREAQKYDRELVQPYTNERKLNPEFEKHYPDVVKDWEEQGVKLHDKTEL